MSAHGISFVPLGRDLAWTLPEDGNSSLGWKARLSDKSRLHLTDGTDLGKRDAYVTVIVGEQGPDGATLRIPSRGSGKKGYFSLSSHDNSLGVVIALSQHNFDRVNLAVHTLATPPTLHVGFGPEDDKNPYELRSGPITGTTSAGYCWDTAAAKMIVVEDWEIRYRFTLDGPAEMPSLPADLRPLRVVGVAFTAAVNLVAIAIAGMALFSATGGFQSFVVSLLLLTYISIVAVATNVDVRLLRLDLASYQRFLRLRSLVGIPTTSEETQYLSKINNDLDHPGARFWITVAGLSIVGLMAIGRLLFLLI